MKPDLARKANDSPGFIQSNVSSQWTATSVHSVEPKSHAMTSSATESSPSLPGSFSPENYTDPDVQNLSRHNTSSAAFISQHSQIAASTPSSSGHSSIGHRYLDMRPQFARASSVPSQYLDVQDEDKHTPPFSPGLSEGTTLIESELAPETKSLSNYSRGERLEIYYPRGVTSSAGPKEAQDQWLPAVQIIIAYEFINPDLLEEALESPKSGVAVVGSGRRSIPDGNAGMSALGHSLMEFILMHQCYIFRIPAGEYSVSHTSVIKATDLAQTRE